MRQACRGQVSHVIQLKDYFEDLSNVYVITDYFSSGDLEQYALANWEYTPVPEAIVKDILRQLVVAVKELHERHIMHRDIKESNVLVTVQDNKLKVVLADFGISVRLESASATRSRPVGTRGYFPPEMLKFKPYSLPADIWSLGTIMHSLLTMKTP